MASGAARRQATVACPMLGQAKYNRSAMKMRRQLQCNPLQEREKSRRRRNNGEQWKKQCAEQWKQSEIRASASRPVVTPEDR
jgi:hypothetical protein